jgi:cytochrome P450
MVGRVALREFLTRIPAFEVDHERIVWAPGNYVRRPLSAPLTVVDGGRA